MSDYNKNDKTKEHSTSHRSENHDPEYSPMIEAILKAQPLSPLSTGELKVRKLRNEVSVDNA